MQDLKERQKQVLQMIVTTYVDTINPVGSRTISKFYQKCYQGELSPATIRNEMHNLEERDYIEQPHTSAGRVPTDKGYRYYVDCLMPEPKVPPHVAALVAREYRDKIHHIETLVERTSKILSTLSEQAGLVIFPSFEQLALKRIELTPIGRQHLLVVCVTNSGFIQSSMIDMKEVIPESELSRLNRFLNQELEGVLLADIHTHLADRLEQAQDSLRALYKAAHAIVLESFPKAAERRIALEGSRHVLEQPEFQNFEKSRRLFKMLESKESLMNLIHGTSEHPGAQVQIGLEHQCQDMRDCSFVTAQYRVNERIVGTLGVVGPRRMHYDRIVSLVDFVSRRLGEALEKWL